jgi:hypothetical protein
VDAGDDQRGADANHGPLGSLDDDSEHFSLSSVFNGFSIIESARDLFFTMFCVGACIQRG